jgi:hypothetical protein
MRDALPGQATNAPLRKDSENGGINSSNSQC